MLDFLLYNLELVESLLSLISRLEVSYQAFEIKLFVS